MYVIPLPIYRSWPDFLARTTGAERMRWCRSKAAKANRWCLMSGVPKVHLRAADVWEIIEARSGRCVHCGSLAVESWPRDPSTGRPVRWSGMGERIGSLEHIKSRFEGGDNDRANLDWACYACNTRKTEEDLRNGFRLGIGIEGSGWRPPVKPPARGYSGAEGEEDMALYEWPYLHSEELWSELFGPS